MAKLVIFLSFLVSLTLVLAMNGYKSLPTKNEKFDLIAWEKQYKEKLALLEAAKKSEHIDAEAVGDEEEVVEEGPQVVTIPLDTEELKNGHFVYHSKGKCLTCHGKSGEGRKSQKAPLLAGQYDWYLYEQLQNMKNKVRENKVMDPYLKNLTDKDMQDVSTYLSKLPTSR